MEDIQNNPLSFIGFWDLVLLILGVYLRLLRSINLKLKEYKSSFSLKKYFDNKHIIRWLIHLTVAIIALLSLPQVFVYFIQPKYFDGLTFWALAGSPIIGFLGYDLVKFLEKISIPILKKIGVTSVVLVFLVSISSCSALDSGRDQRRALKRIEKARQLYPDYFETKVIDTTINVVIEEHITDTVVILEHHDTVKVINNERMTVRVVHDTITREFYVEGTCKSDTIYKELTFQTEAIREPTLFEKFQMSVGPAFLFLILVALLLFAKWLFKK